MTTSSIIYYIVVLTLQGSSNIELKQFPNFESCEKFMRANHKSLIKEYYKPGEQRMTGSGCRIKRIENQKIAEDK